MARARTRAESGTTSAAVLGTITAFLTLLTAVIGLMVTVGPWELPGSGAAGGGAGSNSVEQPQIPHDPFASAEVFLSRDSGPGGTEVNVSGEGFASGEDVVIRFHTEQIGRTTANGDGRFSNVGVTIPSSFSFAAPQQFSVVATGEQSAKSAQAPFQLTG
jgi:hypothetical protein